MLRFLSSSQYLSAKVCKPRNKVKNFNLSKSFWVNCRKLINVNMTHFQLWLKKRWVISVRDLNVRPFEEKFTDFAMFQIFMIRWRNGSWMPKGQKRSLSPDVKESKILKMENEPEFESSAELPKSPILEQTELSELHGTSVDNRKEYKIYIFL